MFLPIKPDELRDRGFDAPDFVVISGDAYVDHPSFGHAIIGRLLESEGFGVGIIAQPVKDSDFMVFGPPRAAFLITGGVVDSMVNNYSVAKNKRDKDVYSEGGKRGKRPDRAVDVYSNALKRIYPDVPVIIGGIEASHRRLSHYDYWDDTVRRSILMTSGADLLVYGMGEYPILEIAKFARKNVPLNNLKNISGTAYLTKIFDAPETVRDAIGGKSNGCVMLPSHERVSTDKKLYCKAFVTAKEYGEYPSNSILIQKQDYENYVVINPPAPPLGEKLMDRTYSLPFERKPHPMYKDGVPAIEEVEFSVTAHRGCFGNCSFCALTYHQGRIIDARSADSIIAEVEEIAAKKDFKGYIHDIGGPSANFHEAACDKQAGKGACGSRSCAGFNRCPNLKVSHKKFMEILRRARNIKGVKKVFVRSGLRYDYIMADPDKSVLPELVEHHISGQLKVAPEHCSNNVLEIMNKPAFENYLAFAAEFEKINKQKGKKQFLVPYFISSHPGCTLNDAIKLTEYLKSIGYMPLQVQDFYPTPSTLSTTMYYTEMDPYTLKPVYSAKTPREKAMQRALLQYRLPQNQELISQAYKEAEKDAPKAKKIPSTKKSSTMVKSKKQEFKSKDSSGTKRTAKPDNKRTSNNKDTGYSKDNARSKDKPVKQNNKNKESNSTKQPAKQNRTQSKNNNNKLSGRTKPRTR